MFLGGLGVCAVGAGAWGAGAGACGAVRVDSPDGCSRGAELDAASASKLRELSFSAPVPASESSGSAGSPNPALLWPAAGTARRVAARLNPKNLVPGRKREIMIGDIAWRETSLNLASDPEPLGWIEGLRMTTHFEVQLTLAGLRSGDAESRTGWQILTDLNIER